MHRDRRTGKKEMDSRATGEIKLMGLKTVSGGKGAEITWNDI